MQIFSTSQYPMTLCLAMLGKLVQGWSLIYSTLSFLWANHSGVFGSLEQGRSLSSFWRSCIEFVKAGLEPTGTCFSRKLQFELSGSFFLSCLTRLYLWTLCKPGVGHEVAWPNLERSLPRRVVVAEYRSAQLLPYCMGASHRHRSKGAGNSSVFLEILPGFLLFVSWSNLSSETRCDLGQCAEFNSRPKFPSAGNSYHVLVWSAASGIRYLLLLHVRFLVNKWQKATIPLNKFYHVLGRQKKI